MIQEENSQSILPKCDHRQCLSPMSVADENQAFLSGIELILVSNLT